MGMEKDNIWDLAVTELINKESNEQETTCSTVLFTGNKQSGKSSIIYRFLERNDSPKTTLALEYLFGRRSKGIENMKDVCHIWELGGGTLFTHLLEIPISPQNLRSLNIILVLDLSVPEELWFTAETLISALKLHIKNAVNQAKGSQPNLGNSLNQEAVSRIGENHPDTKIIEPFPVPLLILGSKYDIFQNFDPEKKKIICRCLRYLAHINGAALQFVSTKSESLINKAKVSISNLVFSTPRSQITSLDYNKPIMVPFGGDSFQLIGDFSLGEEASPTRLSRDMDKWKHTFMSYFPQVVTKPVIPDDPGKDPNFKERDIDIMRAQMERELEEQRRQNKAERKDEWNDIDF